MAESTPLDLRGKSVSGRSRSGHCPYVRFGSKAANYMQSKNAMGRLHQYAGTHELKGHPNRFSNPATTLAVLISDIGRLWIALS